MNKIRPTHPSTEEQQDNPDSEHAQQGRVRERQDQVEDQLDRLRIERDRREPHE
jgi:hypothetical protein